ncbi:MAG: DCC1-like thiol-disulfide oxidoreductase family protein [Thermodesulfobacteriota bacterium]|jgi:predicted DCC family thiol-disulfide oxidoreductase YuxK
MINEYSNTHSSTQKKSLIIFDGLCNLCNWTVNFVIKRDKKSIFNFTTCQSDAGKQILTADGLDIGEVSTVYLIENKTVYDKSTAVLRILKKLPFPWYLAYLLIVIPKRVRDYIYNLVARNRYRWFGIRNGCSIPNKKNKKNF